MLIRADVLERRGGRCRMVEVKSATRLKEYHLQDIAIQGWVAEGAGVPLDGLSVAVIDTDFVYPGGGDYRGLLREIPVADQARPLMAHIPGWVRGFNELLAGPLPAIAHRAPSAGGRSSARSWPSARGRRARRAARPERSATRTAPARSRPTPRSAALDPAATAFLATLPYPRYYLDFETVQFAVPVWAGTSPFQQIVFQWSCHVEERPGEVSHREFLDTSGEAPMRARRGGPARGARRPRAPSSSTTTSRSGGSWRWRPCCPTWRRRSNAVAGRLVDLLRLTRDHYEHPALNGSYSLKTVLPTVDAELDHALLEEVQDGLSAQAAYHEAVDPATPDERRDVLRALAARVLRPGHAGAGARGAPVRDGGAAS